MFPKNWQQEAEDCTDVWKTFQSLETIEWLNSGFGLQAACMKINTMSIFTQMLGALDKNIPASGKKHKGTW